MRASAPIGRSLTSSRLRWALAALLVVGAALVLLQQEAGPWLVALSGGLAVLVSVAALGAATPAAGEAGSFVRHVETGWTALRTELARSRRHDRKFAIVGVPDRVWSGASEPRVINAEAALDVAQSVQGMVRRPDRAWADASMLHILLTDCDREQAEAFLERARTVMPQLFDDERVRMVVFPDDGITLGALVSGLVEDPAAAIPAAAASNAEAGAAAGMRGVPEPAQAASMEPMQRPPLPRIGKTLVPEALVRETVPLAIDDDGEIRR